MNNDHGIASPGSEDRFELNHRVNITALAHEQMNLGWACMINENYASFLKYNADTRACLVEINVMYSKTPIEIQTYISGQNLPVGSNLVQAQMAIRDCSDMKSFLLTVGKQNICKGIHKVELIEEFQKTNTTVGKFCNRTDTVRAIKCKILTHSTKCIECLKYEYTLKTAILHGKKKSALQHINCNNRFLTAQHLVAKSTWSRLKEKASILKLRRLQNRFKQMIDNGYCLGPTDNSDMKKLLLQAKKDMDNSTPLGIFIEQQLKAAKRKSCHGYRWSPEIIAWCLYIYKLSPTTYRAIRAGGYLLLPSEKTLQDFSKHFENGPGFPENLPSHIIEQMSKFEGHQKYVSLIFDEMKISEEVVFKRHTGEMVGFVHLNQSEN